MIKPREIVKIYGLATGLSAVVNLFYLMLLALYQNHRVIMDFNQYGEHYIEIVMFLTGVPCLIYVGYSMIKLS